MDNEVNRAKRLNQTLTRLQSEFDERSDHLTILSKDFALETRPDEKIRKRFIIAEKKQELEELELSILGIEKLIGEISLYSREISPVADHKYSSLQENLFTSLLALDFWEQHTIFHQAIARGQGGAFLISGEIYYGQNWLLKKLVELERIGHSGELEPIVIELQSCFGNPNIINVWDRILEKLPNEASSKLNSNSKFGQEQLRQIVIKGIIRYLKMQDVVLIFDNIQFNGYPYFTKLIEYFWQPLIKAIAAEQDLSDRFKILMFMIDETGATKGWKNIRPSKEIDSNWEPQIPIYLPTIKCFKSGLLLKWVRENIRFMPRDVMVLQYQDIVKQILQSSNDEDIGNDNNEDIDKLRKLGKPGEVLVKIYNLFGYNWYEVERKWKF